MKHPWSLKPYWKKWNVQQIKKMIVFGFDFIFETIYSDFFFWPKIYSVEIASDKKTDAMLLSFCRITRHHHDHNRMPKRLELNRSKVHCKHCCMICMQLVQQLVKRRLICKLVPNKMLHKVPNKLLNKVPNKVPNKMPNKMLRLGLNIRQPVLYMRLELQSILVWLQQRPTNKQKRSMNKNKEFYKS